MIRVLIADDHHLVRQGIRALLEKAADIQVVGEAADGQQAVDLAQKLAPDVLITDIAMPHLNGTQVTERVRAWHGPTQVVILSMYSDEVLVRQALHNGARGYLLKNSIAEELLLAVRAAQRGETYLSPPISRVVLDGFLAPGPESKGPDVLGRLSPREREVWQLIAEGQTNASIAHTLRLSVKTVEKHRASLMTKLNVHDVAGLVRLAVKHGLVAPER